MADTKILLQDLKDKLSKISENSKKKDEEIRILKEELREAKKPVPPVAPPTPPPPSKIEVDINNAGIDEVKQELVTLGTNLNDSITSQTKTLKEEMARERKLELADPVREVRVSNFPIFPKPVFKIPEIFKIDKPDWLDFSPISNKLEEITTAIKDFAWPKDPKDPLAVRLSDGKEWLSELTKVVQMGGGGGSVPRYSGKDGVDYVPTVATLSLPQFDFVSMALSGGDTTETYTFKRGGSGGTLVSTVVVVYTTSGRTVISTVTKTPIT